MTRTRLKHLIRLAALIALQVVLSRFLAINIGTVLKFSFGFVAVVMAAHLYGVPGACAVAAVSDVIGAVLFPMGEFFIGYTLTATLTGLIYGLFLYKKQDWPRTIAAVCINQFVLSLFLNTLWISILYGSPYVPLLATRIVQCLILTAVQLVCIQAIAKAISRYGKSFSAA